jgi:hypothetical protein
MYCNNPKDNYKFELDINQAHYQLDLIITNDRKVFKIDQNNNAKELYYDYPILLLYKYKYLMIDEDEYIPTGQRDKKKDDDYEQMDG